MFWDRMAGVYDIFANLYNAKAHRVLCSEIARRIRPSDEVLDCACGTGLVSVAVAPRCKRLVATDFSEKMLRRACRPGGRLIIPTYMNRTESASKAGVNAAIDAAGADFKREFTPATYRDFFAEAGYANTEFVDIDGRVPCTIAIVQP